ncbi:hypothetical protein D3C87_1153480 [compost metagenome]
MGPDICDGPGLTTNLRVHTPVVIGLVHQPILHVAAMNHQDLPQLPAADHGSHLLDQRVLPIVIINCMHNPFILSSL